MMSIKNDTGWVVVTSANKTKDELEQLKTNALETRMDTKKVKTDEQLSKPVRSGRRRGGSSRKKNGSLSGTSKATAPANTRDDDDGLPRSLKKKMQDLSIKYSSSTSTVNQLQQQPPRRTTAPVNKPSAAALPPLPLPAVPSKSSSKRSTIFQSTPLRNKHESKAAPGTKPPPIIVTSTPKSFFSKEKGATRSSAAKKELPSSKANVAKRLSKSSFIESTGLKKLNSDIFVAPSSPYPLFSPFAQSRDHSDQQSLEEGGYCDGTSDEPPFSTRASTGTPEFSWSNSVYNNDSHYSSNQSNGSGNSATGAPIDHRCALNVSAVTTDVNDYNANSAEHSGGKFGAIGEERKRKLSLKMVATLFESNCTAVDSKSIGSYDSGFSSNRQPFQL